MPNISLVTYTGQTVTPLDDALVYETAINQSGMIYGGTVTIKNANNLHITAGHGIVCGRKFTIFDSDITIPLSSSGTLLGRLYVQLDLSNTGTPVQILYETGASLTPVQQDQNVNIMNGVFEFNLATFSVSTSTLSNLVAVAPSAEPSSGAGSVVKITTTESALAGKMCTLTDGTDTLNATFDNNLEAIFYGVQMTGTVIASATDGTQTASDTLTITYFGVYTKAIAFWGATINITTTTTDFYNQNIAVTQDGISVATITFDGTGNASYLAPSTGEYVFTVTYGGETYSSSVTVSEETTYSVSIDLATPVTITVTLYSAAADTVSYTDANGSQTVTTDNDGQATNVSITVSSDSPTVTFTSSVAKNPDDLTADYSKTVTLTAGTTEVYVMPDKIIYWYGYYTNTFVNLTAANVRDTVADPVFNTNNIYTYIADETTGSYSHRSGFIVRSIDVDGETSIKTLRGSSSAVENSDLVVDISEVATGAYDIVYIYRSQGTNYTSVAVYTESTVTTGYGGTQVATSEQTTNIYYYLYALWLE